ncbi:MAG: hypothetical protein QG573_2749 [Acidobacteriota bacterium]|nr:hypothetical protein [Acidobacteriota bacterium]
MIGREVTVRKFALGDPAIEAADREFWAALSAEERLALTWDLVCQHLAWTHPNEPEPRLQRSVFRIIGRER